MKILEFNANYFLGYNGKITDYLLKANRAVSANDESERDSLERFVNLLEEEKPDLVFIAEVDGGSFRTGFDNHMEEIVSKCSERGLEYDYMFQNKYGPDKIYSKLPFLKHMGNGILFKENFEAEVHYISPGSKELVYEVKNDEKNFSLFAVHLPLFKRTRRKQIEELSKVIANKEKDRRVMISGDFNNYYGKKELRPILRKNSMRMVSPGETLHNSFLPYKELDLYLHSNNVEILDCDILNFKISDHLPSIVRVNL